MMDNANELVDLPGYHFPALDLLSVPVTKVSLTADLLDSNKQKIVNTLESNGINIEGIRATIGPTLTLYEIIPAPGSRVAKIKALQADLGLHLAANVRVIGPIPGKGTMGIEIPHDQPDVVAMRAVLATSSFQVTPMDLPVALGKTMDNLVCVLDLAALPHLLIAGATGQGKSVFLNVLITSLLYKKHPSELKFVLIDINKLELSPFRKIEKHFLAALPNQSNPVISDVGKAIDTLNALSIELDRRYDLLKDAGLRHIKDYNSKFVGRQLDPSGGHRYLPFIVTVIDEFADLLTPGKEVEVLINRLAQLGRPAGIHLVIATQRPSVKVITGTIKANFSSRLAFRVASYADSRTILDAGGAELLNGLGDMLLSTGANVVHLQGTLIETDEVGRVCEFIGAQKSYSSAFLLPKYGNNENSTNTVFDPDNIDPLFEDSARLIVLHQQGSTSLIQRKLKLGYNRAGRIIDQLEAAGIVGPFEGSKAREVLFADDYSLELFLAGLKPGNMIAAAPVPTEPESVKDIIVESLPLTLFRWLRNRRRPSLKDFGHGYLIKICTAQIGCAITTFLYSMSDLGKNISKVVAVTAEVEASFRFIQSGLLNLKSTKFIGANNHVTLQLLAAGFERLLKILLLLKHKHLHGDFPELASVRKYFSSYHNGHGIDLLLNDLLIYADTVPLMQSVPMVAEDLAYLKQDQYFKSLLHILTEFAVAQRYFYIDTIVLDNFNPAINPFELFSDFVYAFNEGIDVSGLTHEQEDERAFKETVICIEKGVRAISRFFTHGLDDLGRQYYGDFSSFIFLKEDDLGSLKYTEKRVSASDKYLPLSKLSPAYLKLQLTASSKTVRADDHPDWPFAVPTVKVYFARPIYYFARIGSQVFALTGATSTHYQIPVYLKSPHLKPKGYATYLLEIAQGLA